MTVEEVLTDVLRDRPYFDESGGGITISGGEPTAQPGFAGALLREAGRAGLNRAVETCGYADTAIYADLISNVELFLFDIKETDCALHRRFTGVDLNRILDNLRFLHGNGAGIVLRCPIIPGCNDRDQHIRNLGALYGSMPGLLGLELLPYHSLGVAKAKKIGRIQETYTAVSPIHLERWREMLRSMNVNVMENG